MVNINKRTNVPSATPSLSSFPIGKKLNTTREEAQRKGHLLSCFCLHGKFTRNSFKTIFQEFRKLVQLLKRKIGILEEHQLQLMSQKGSDFLVLFFTALEASRNINYYKFPTLYPSYKKQSTENGENSLSGRNI